MTESAEVHNYLFSNRLKQQGRHVHSYISGAEIVILFEDTKRRKESHIKNILEFKLN
jgi:hypothetical protein